MGVPVNFGIHAPFRRPWWHWRPSPVVTVLTLALALWMLGWATLALVWRLF